MQKKKVLTWHKGPFGTHGIGRDLENRLDCYFYLPYVRALHEGVSSSISERACDEAHFRV
jgi:hypothetical protein